MAGVLFVGVMLVNYDDVFLLINEWVNVLSPVGCITVFALFVCISDVPSVWCMCSYIGWRFVYCFVTSPCEWIVWSVQDLTLRSSLL